MASQGLSPSALLGKEWGHSDLPEVLLYTAVLLAVADFCYYSLHRLLHTGHAFGPAHAVALVLATVAPPLLVRGAPPEALPPFVGTVLLSALRVGLGSSESSQKLYPLLCPAEHVAHRRFCRSNFGGLSFSWDRLLGTYKAALLPERTPRIVTWYSPLVLAVLLVLYSPRRPEAVAADGKVHMDLRALSLPRLPYFLEGINLLGTPFKASLVPLDKQALLQLAQARTGLSRFWDEEAEFWNAGLDHLVHDMEHSEDRKHHTLLGRLLFREQVVGSLVAHLKVVDVVTRHPEVLRRDLGAVAVITGWARTGSTALHRLVCEHPRARCLRFFEALQPVSDVEPTPAEADDARVTAARVAAAAQSWMRPWFKLMMPMEALTPFEEIFLSAEVGSSAQYLLGGAGPAHRKWYTEADHTAAYRYVKMVYQVMDFQLEVQGGLTRSNPKTPKTPGKRVRVMKSPQHVMHLQAVREVFGPKATIIMTQRDMRSVLESFLTVLTYGVGGSFDRIDTVALGANLLDSMEFAMRRYRENKELVDVRVQFEDFARNNTHVAGEVLRRIGLDPAEAKLAEFERLNPRQGASVLRYSLDAFGVSESEVERRLQALQ